MDTEARERIARVWPEMCARLAAGELVKDVREQYGIKPHEQAAFIAEVPGAREAWESAREQSSHAFMDEALAIARGVSNSTDAQNTTRALDPHYDRRVHVDTLKWAARIRNPRTYSDKQTLDVNVRTVDLTRIISEAQARLEASRVLQLGVIDVRPEKGEGGG
jgi:hypothetical protein